METIITIVAGGVLLGMMILMINYARFIHRYPKQPSQAPPSAPTKEGAGKDGPNKEESIEP